MTLINDNFNTGTPYSESDKVFVKNRLELVTSRVEMLNKLCSALDPYQDIPATFQEQLNALGIYELNDPFVVTNKLVVMLEESIEELQGLEDRSKSIVNE